MPLLRRCRRWLSGLVSRVRQTLGTHLWARPTAMLLAGTGTDLVRSRGQLLAEDALLRQQPHVLRRSANARP